MSQQKKPETQNIIKIIYILVDMNFHMQSSFLNKIVISMEDVP